MVAFDLSRLNGRVVEKFGNREKFADALGRSRSTVYSRLRGETAFRADEIHQIIAPDCLDIPADEISDYFFTPLVR